MNWFRNMSIKYKLVVLVLGITGITILVSGSLWTYFDLQEFKKDMKHNLEILAGAIGRNSRVAVLFHDKKSASMILESLNSDPNIAYAALYDSKGDKIVDYHHPDRPAFQAPTSMDLGFRLLGDNLELILPIFFENEIVGRIYLNSTLARVNERLKNNLLILVGIGFCTMAVAFLLILKFQNVFTRPLSLLAQSAQKMTQNPDYSLRVSYNSADEIGTLCQGFNEMLQQLESREKELDGYRFHLEEQVFKRTSALIEANENLTREIKERKNTEKRLNISLQEKEILMKEVNHRAKNNMQILSSLLWLEAKEAKIPGLARKLEDSRQRIMAMSLVHDHIFNAPDLTRIQFEDYMRSLFKEQLHSFGLDSNPVQFKLETDQQFMLVNPGMYLGLIINELLSNSFKHAFPDGRQGEIQLRLHKIDNENFEMVYRDNGVGLPDNMDLEKKNSLGLRLLHQLIQLQLEGDLHIQSRKPLEIVIRFPSMNEE